MKEEIFKAKINGYRQIAHVFGIGSKTGFLFVHGGAGNPNRHKIRDLLKPLYERFLVAAYDQRGTGGSYRLFPKKKDFTIYIYVRDIIEWGKLIKAKYRLSKLVLVGESWGSAIGVLSLKEGDAPFDAYLGYGQFVSETKAREWQYSEMAKGLNLKELGLKKPVNGSFASLEQEKLFYSLLYPYFEPMDYPSYKEREIMPFDKSGEYTFCARRGWRKGTRLLNKLNIPLSSVTLPTAISIPFFICQGREDFITPYPLAKEYFETIKAHKKDLFTFETGHLPAFEDPKRFCELLIGLFSDFPNRIPSFEIAGFGDDMAVAVVA